MNLKLDDNCTRAVIKSDTTTIYYVVDEYENHLYRFNVLNGLICEIKELDNYCETMLEDIEDYFSFDYKLVYLDIEILKLIINNPTMYESGYRVIINYLKNNINTDIKKLERE